MVDDKINKLIEKFIDVKESKGLTEEQVAKLSGFTPLRIHNLFNGKVVHPSFDLTTKVAEALEIPFDEVCEILGLNVPNDIEVGCECYIGEERINEVYYIINQGTKDTWISSKLIRDLTIWEIEGIDKDGHYFSTKEKAEASMKWLFDVLFNGLQI